MNILVIVLIIIICILITYLFLMNKEIKRINTNFEKILKIDTNQELHSEFTNKELNILLIKINNLMNYIREKESELAQKNNSLRNEITNITHDLRTPLTSAIGYIELILKSNLSKEETEKELKIVESRLLRLEELINSFFDFSITTKSNRKIEFSKVNLIKVIEECISHYFDDFSKNNRKIIFENDANQCIINSNIDILTRVIDNLISNAFKHSEKDLKIKLSNKDKIELSFENEVINHNIDVSHIFDEFYTQDISRTKGNTGLGLAIAKNFTEILGGKITAKTIKNKFEIVIQFSK